MPRRLRVAAVLAALVVLGSGVAVASGAEEAPDQRIYGVSGLSAPVGMVVDRWGVPHIYATNTQDLYLAQGFNAARDRLFQIDLWRRRGLGELSSVLGEKYVAQDRATRMFLYRGDMRAEWESYGPEAQKAATAFASGINAYLDWLSSNPRAIPEEFTKLGYSPARWRPEDVVRIRSHGLSKNVQGEVARARVVCAVGGVEADRFLYRLRPEHTTSVPAGLDPCAVPADVLATYQLATQSVTFANGQLRTEPAAEVPSSEGSNNWAVAPDRTATGRPILANDPHRALGAPSLRYITHLSAPGLDVIGAGEPALPGISIGHNGTAAFGLTIFGVDQEDMYVYDLDPADHGRYRYQDGWERIRTVAEDVPVAGQAPRRVELPFTRHGPVISVDPVRHKAYALRTAWLEPGTSPYFGSMKFLRAKNWEQFTEAMRRWGGPAENQVYADTSGDIGWVPGGMAPRRSGFDGLLPVPGDGRFEWRGFHDGAELPREHNPARGFVASANEFNMPPGHPVKVGYDTWTAPYRKQRIDEVLSANSRSTVKDSATLQGDTVSLLAKGVVDVLRGIGDTPETAEALRLLRGYDGDVRVDSAAAALFETWFLRHLGPAFVNTVLPPDAAKAVFMPDATIVLEALQKPTMWLGPDGVAVRDRLVHSSLAAAFAEVRQRLGADVGAWRWGSLQKAAFSHPLGLGVGPVERGGSWHTVNAASTNPYTYGVTGGASFKMVLDVGDWDKSVAINAPGQSGVRGSAHYDDLLPLWQKDSHFPLVYSRAEVERNAAHRILLVPAG
ncbi:penicillin amidase [Herbihabitans rhizosphaerae]|uniref:Penicillin amidase n=1 Tax=Herbihabitans rhizosphaerae TaxID=1872711 RepID=A0A4Q7KEK2_9PSEU|nr:penicillin acylase family protein [Herbihabitans rhizosphaerae]RZS32685.1 penicillin amidase [Herbihabitans rhizosphaerae]